MRAVWWFVAGSVVVSSASSAHAFCRSATDDPKESSCPSECAMLGIPLAWTQRHVEVKLNERGFPGLSDEQVRDLAQRAFDTWTNVSCDGERMGMTVSVLPESTTFEVGPACKPGVRIAESGEKCEPNDNTIVYFSQEEWEARNLTSRAFALTALWYVDDTGEIVGADMHFNGTMPLANCAASGCNAGESDLLNIATHEAGHFFGLSHSEKANSTMWCNARPNDLSKRSLTPDDIDGICDAYGENARFDDRPSRAKNSSPGCTVHAHDCTPTWAWCAWLVPASWFMRRARRSTRRI